jgi:hypothetical protein
MHSRRAIDSEIPERRLYSIKELCQLTHMTAWRRIGEFDVRRMGRRVFITSESIEQFLAGLPTRAARSAPDQAS